MAKKDALLGSLDLLVLKILTSRPWLHGYALSNAVRLLSEEELRVEEGSLYPALHRMQQAGLLKARWSTNEQGRRTRQYQLTASGRKYLVSEEERWRRLSRAVERVLESV